MLTHTRQLFIGGSTGTKANSTKVCTTKETVTLRYLAGYTKAEAKGHTFTAEVTEGKSYVSVSGSKVKALAAGLGKTATLKISVDGKEAGTTTIKVLKNATQDSLTIVTYIANPDADEAKTVPYIVNPDNQANGLPAEFIAGVQYLFKVPQGGKDTDFRRLYIDDLELAENYYEGTNTVPNKRNFLKKFAVEAAGSKAKIQIRAYQSDKYNGNSTEPKTWNVPVVVKLITAAEQIAYNKFSVTFDTKEHAAQAVKSSNEYLTTGVKPVTDKDFVIELFSDPADVAQRKNVYMAAFAVSGTNDKVVNCTVFGDLDQKAKYEVMYGDEKQEFTTVEWFPTAIRLYYTYAPADTKKLAEGGIATLHKSCVAINENGNDVDLTDKVADYINWYYDVAAVENPANEGSYNLDGSDGSVYFSAADKWALIDVEFVYNNGTKSNDIKNRVKASSAYDVTYALKYYWTVPYDTQAETKTSTKADIYSNTSQQLYVSLIDSNGTVHYNVQGDEDVTFESANEDSLTVDANGLLEAGNKNYDRNTNIYVKYLGKRVGTIPVQVYKTPHLAALKVARASSSDGLLAQATTVGAVSASDAYRNYGRYVPVADGEVFNYVAVDEHGYPYPYFTATIQKIVNDGLDGTDVQIDGANTTLDTKADDAIALAPVLGSATEAIAGINKSKAYKVTFTADLAVVGATTFADSGVKHSASYKLTVVDTETENAKPISAAINFSAKNVDSSDVKSVKVQSVSASTGVANQYAVYGYDRDGFRVCAFYLSENTGDPAYTAATRQDKANRLYLRFADPNGNVRRASVATNATAKVVDAKWLTTLGGAANLAGLTVATFTPVEINKTRAGLPVINNTNKGFVEDNVTNYYVATNGNRYYTYNNVKVRLYNAAGEVGTMQSFAYAPETYGELTWKWTNAGAYSNAGNAAAALDECILFTYTYYDPAGDKHEIKNKTWSELIAATNAGLFDISYVTSANGNDVRFMYAYVNQYAAATFAGFTAANKNTTGTPADLNNNPAATDAWFISDGAMNPGTELWTAVKIDRNTKLAD